MKKIIIIIGVLMSWALPGVLFGDEVTIIEPKGGTYAQGTDMTIRWDYTILSVPIPDNPIQRRVFVKVGSPSNPPGTVFTYDFAVDITAQSYTWNVNKSPGTYVLYFLVNFTKPAVRVSSQPFGIETGSLPLQVVPALTHTVEVVEAPTYTVEVVQPPTTLPATPSLSSKDMKKAQMVAQTNRIKMSSPQAGKMYNIGGTVPIRWSTEKIQNYGYVWLQVCYPNGQSAAGAYTTSNTGSYDWNVKEKIGGSYRIKIWTHGKEYKGMSGVFSIRRPMTKKRTNISAPDKKRKKMSGVSDSKKPILKKLIRVKK